MKTWLFLLISTALVFSAEMSFSDDQIFRFDVADRIQDDHLDVEKSLRLSIYKLGRDEYSFSYSAGDRVNGINQDAYTKVSESYSGRISAADLASFIAEARKVPKGQLAAGQKNKLPYGWLILDKSSIAIHAGPDNSDRQAWKEFIEKAVATYVPAGRLVKEVKVFEGDTVAAKDVTLSELTSNPSAYDGKRIRVTGYYSEQDGRHSLSLSRPKGKLDGSGIWVGMTSTFARFDDAKGNNGRFQTFEGVFYAEKNGMTKGRLGLITKAGMAQGKAN